MKTKLVTPLFIFTLTLTLKASTVFESDNEGLGKLERLDRLETTVNLLKSEVDKLKRSGGAPAAADSATQNTFARQLDLLQLKTELSKSSAESVNNLKIDLQRTQRQVEALSSQVSELRETEIKDIDFRLGALQKSFEALERSMPQNEGQSELAVPVVIPTDTPEVLSP